MNLSVSPRDKWRDGGYSDISSPPPTTPRPSPAPSLSHIHLSEDEEPYKRSRTSTNLQYQCTWRGCGLINSCQTIMEKHVRGHLGLPDPPPGTDYGGEEDFYYTEIEPDDLTMTMEMDPTSDSGCSSSSNDGMNITYKLKSQSSPIKPSAGGSKQPESENYVRILPNITKSPSSSLASSVPSNFGSSHPLGDHIGMARPSYEAPTTIYLVNTLTTPNKPQLPHHNNDHIYNSSSWQGKKTCKHCASAWYKSKRQYSVRWHIPSTIRLQIYSIRSCQKWQKMQKGLRYWPKRALVHSVQMEKGLWEIHLKSQNFINSIHMNVIMKQQANCLSWKSGYW